MTQTIGGGLARVQAKQTARALHSSVLSVDDALDELAEMGYDGIDFEPLGREVRATSYNAKGYKVQAIGRNDALAAQALVRVLRR